jgi:DeoR family transcriptional regulator, catabolite repression regulator
MLNNKVTIKETMLDLSKVPVVTVVSTLKEALDKMTQFRLGIALVVDSDSKLLGVLTDGDLRRLLLTRQSPLPALLVTPAIEFGNKDPHTIHVDASVEEAKNLMVSHEIWDLPVVTKDYKVVGLLHRHSLS